MMRWFGFQFTLCALPSVSIKVNSVGTDGSISEHIFDKKQPLGSDMLTRPTTRALGFLMVFESSVAIDRARCFWNSVTRGA